MFALLFRCFSVKKRVSVLSTCQLNFLPPNRTGIGGRFPSKNMNPIYEGMPYIKCTLNIADNLMYTLKFQAQNICPINYCL